MANVLPSMVAVPSPCGPWFAAGTRALLPRGLQPRRPDLFPIAKRSPAGRWTGSDLRLRRGGRSEQLPRGQPARGQALLEVVAQEGLQGPGVLLDPVRPEVLAHQRLRPLGAPGQGRQADAEHVGIAER